MRLTPFKLFKMCLGAIIVAAPMAQGYSDNATWTGASTNSLSNSANWTVGGPPTSGQQGTFGPTGLTTPQFGAALSQTIGTLSFPNGAQAYTFGSFYNNVELSLDMSGVVNYSTTSQTFDVGNVSNTVTLNFDNSASGNAGTGIVNYNIDNGGQLKFNDTSSAGNVNIIVTDSSDTPGGVFFNDGSLASSANITLNGSISETGGFLIFSDSSIPQTASITANQSSIVLFDTNITEGVAPSITLNDNAYLVMYQSNNVASLNSNSSTTSVQLYDDDEELVPTNLTTNEALGVADVYAGQIIGTTGSTLTVDGEGSLQLTLPMQAYDSPYIWNAIVDNGTLIGDSTNLNRFVTVNDPGTVEFDQNFDDELYYADGQLSGDGNILKTGLGTLYVITNNTTFTGNTEVQAGNLSFYAPFGSTAGTLTVDVDGTVSGEGPINSNVVVNGYIAPGDGDIDTLVIDGTYTQNPGSVYLVNLDGNGDSSLIEANGASAQIAGTVAASSPDGTYLINVPYTILTATGAASGAYDNAVQNINPYLVPTLSYLDYTVLLTLNTAFSSFAETGNQFTVASQLDSIVDPSAAEQNLLQILVASDPGVFNNALDQLSGEQYASLFQITEQSNRRFLRDLYGPLLFGQAVSQNNGCGNYCDDVEVWQTVHYGRTFQRGHYGARGYKARDVDVALGVQMSVDNTWKAGIAGFYEENHIDYNLSGHSRANTVRGALYGIYQDDCFYALADAIFGYSHFNVKRDIRIGDFDVQAHATPKIYDADFYIEGGLNYLVADCVNLQPFFGVEAGYYWHDHSKENGAYPVNLEIKRKHYTSCDSRLGLRITSTLAYDIVFSADVAWQHWYTKDNNKVHLRFRDFGDSFTIHGPKQKRDVVDGSVYMGKTFCDNFTLFARAFGERSDNYSNYSVALGFDFQL